MWKLKAKKAFEPVIYIAIYVNSQDLLHFAIQGYAALHQETSTCVCWIVRSLIYWYIFMLSKS